MADFDNALRDMRLAVLGALLRKLGHPISPNEIQATPAWLTDKQIVERGIRLSKSAWWRRWISRDAVRPSS